MGNPSNKATNTSTKKAVLHSVLSSERAVGINFRAAFPYPLLFACHDGCTHMEGNKFRPVTPSVQVWQSSFSFITKEVVMIAPLQIVHTHLRHRHGELVPVCANCGAPLTVPHILVEFHFCNEECHTFHLHCTLYIFGDDSCNVSNVQAFLNDIGRKKVKLSL
jgi:hypothetical protein